MLTSVHTLFQSLVRLHLTEEFFLMSTQIPTCWLCKETLQLSSTLLKGLRTQPRKYVVTEESNIFFEVTFRLSCVWCSGSTVQYDFELLAAAARVRILQGCVFMASSFFESNWTKI